MLKILQARLQQYANRELPDVQADFRKGRGTRDQIVNIRWIIEKAREFQKNIYFCSIDYAKAFDCVDHNKLWRILQEMGIPDHLTCLLRNLYTGQEATVRIGHGTTDWFQIGKGVCQGYILSSAYLRLLTFLLAILIPACASSSPVFLMMYSACMLNKQGKQYTALKYTFSYLEPVCCSMSSSNCCFLTCI